MLCLACSFLKLIRYVVVDSAEVSSWFNSQPCIFFHSINSKAAHSLADLLSSDRICIEDKSAAVVV